MKVHIICTTCKEERIDESVDSYTGMDYLSSEITLTCANCGYETIELTPIREESEAAELERCLYAQGTKWKED